jgi:DNA-binding transcriptional LysR family regulator
MPHVAAFCAAHPAISIDLMLGERQLDLREDAIDLAVRLGDPGRPPGLIRTRLGEFRLVACAAPEYLAERGEPRTAGDLAGHACVVQSASTLRDVWTFSRGGGSSARRAAGESAKVSGPLRSNDVESLAIAVRAGMGIAVLPDFLVAGDLRRGNLRQVLPRLETPRVAIYAVYAERRHLPARVRALLDFLVVRLRGERGNSKGKQK